MNPASSVVAFTIAAGAAQGLVVVLALGVLAGVPASRSLVSLGLLVAIVLLVGGLGASFLHLGRPTRAWRAAAMWRTSWLSREVIVLPAFMAVVALWWLAVRTGSSVATHVALPCLAIVVAALLWHCTAMIYACLRFIEEWAQPLTLVNFVLVGVSSGLVLAGALAALIDEPAVLRMAAAAAAVATLGAGAGRAAAWRHNASIRHRSTLQTATGIHAEQLAQTSMGMSAGSFNTREFFHRATRRALRRIKAIALICAFALPSLLMAAVAAGMLPDLAALVALIVQVPGLIADRWLFFAQAKHPQNLYYQVVS